MRAVGNDSPKLIVVLLLITIFSLLLHRYSLNHSFVIDSETEFDIAAIDDSLSGGTTSSRAWVESGKLILECEIGHKYQWPFCEYNIDLTSLNSDGDIRGIDFSSYDRVGFWIKYVSENKSGIRVHLRNFNESYSTLNNSESIKYNSVEWFGEPKDYPVWVPMNSFQVSTWWIVDNNIAIDKMGPELTNIYSIEVATGTGIPEGMYRLEVERIEFQGKWVRADYLYLGIVSLWFFSGLLYIALWIYKHKRALSASLFRERELEAINRVLNIKSRELEDQVTRDPLTGVLNREGLQKLFLEGATQLDRTNGLCIAFMDLDNFKGINDTFGHAVGDEVLKQFTKVIIENVRSTELVARWGGEEFILASPNSSLRGMKVLSEKLRALVESQSWPEGIQVTCSFGVAKMEDETTSQFIHRADTALYSAKQQGRNRVVVASAP